jgi:DNA-directed RNA polymerase alpha subunit
MISKFALHGRAGAEGEGEVKHLLLDPTPDMPDDTEIDQIRWPTRILTVLQNAGIQTVREIRETSDADILRFRRGGPQVVAFLRTALGRPT